MLDVVNVVKVGVVVNLVVVTVVVIVDVVVDVVVVAKELLIPWLMVK